LTTRSISPLYLDGQFLQKKSSHPFEIRTFENQPLFNFVRPFCGPDLSVWRFSCFCLSNTVGEKVEAKSAIIEKDGQQKWSDKKREKKEKKINEKEQKGKKE
jgi:hypothetical protein